MFIIGIRHSSRLNLQGLACQPRSRNGSNFYMPASSAITRHHLSLLAMIVLVPTALWAQKKEENTIKERFEEFTKTEWKEVFHDPCTGDWKERWTLDGEVATVTNAHNGMELKAGPEPKNDAHHAVLWTKQEFMGDLRIDYEYTPTDEQFQFVSILYIQATGSGKKGFDADISKWADQRKVPSMRTYYANMNLYHISYNAYGADKSPGLDYVRGRRYMCAELKGTELENEYKETGFFQQSVPHQITVIKRDMEVFMHIRAGDKEQLCHFVNNKFPAVTKGRIGLRHMFTRSARYKDFKISARP